MSLSDLASLGSFVSGFAVTIALVQTWLHPMINLYTGLALLAVLTLCYQSLRNKSHKN